MDRPNFTKMTTEQIHEVLSRNHVGRMAYAKGNQIDIEPVHYVYAEGWLYGRTSKRAQLRRTGESWWPVAFEVDEIDGMFEWRSVVVHGGFYTLSSNGPKWEREAYDHAVELLRGLVPATFTAEDPTPFRNVVFRIAVQEATGRVASLKPVPGGASAGFQTGHRNIAAHA